MYPGSTIKQKVLNFIQKCSRPFSIREVISKTGVCEETARAYLREMAAEGRIKKISNKGQLKIYMKMRMTPELARKLRMKELQQRAKQVQSNSFLYYFGVAAMLSLMFLQMV